MKPSDHPEFFRLPPPEGRSRESTLRLDASGRFSHEGEAVAHAGMARAFASWIQRHPDNGRYILSNGWDWTYFSVEDVPFFVQRVRAEGGVPWVVLSDGSEEPLDAGSLRMHAEDAVYVGVKERLFDARFSQRAQLELAPWLEEEPDGTLALVISGVRYALGPGGSPG